VNEDIEGETTCEENNTSTESTVLNTVLATAYIKHSLEKNEQVQKDQNTLTFCSSAINTPQKGKLLPIFRLFWFWTVEQLNHSQKNMIMFFWEIFNCIIVFHKGVYCDKIQNLDVD
jgi:hypothetical protein